MSRGYVFQPTYTVENEDGEREQRTSSIWWVGYSVNGDQKRKSAKTTDKEEAQKFLTQCLAEADRLGGLRRDLSKVEFSELAELIRKDYERNGFDSDILERRLDHLLDAFGGFRVVQITNQQVDAFVDARIEEGAANATVNRDLSCLRRMYTLGEKADLVAPERVPDVSDYMLKEADAREGFWTEEEFRQLKAHLPPRLRPLMDFAMTTGWRRSELLSRKWEHLGLEHGNGILRLEADASKTGTAREFPLNDHLRSVVERQLEQKGRTEEEYGCTVEYLFFYFEPSRNGLPAGRRIKSFRRAWATATEAVGKPDRIFHDFRRSCARRMLMHGFPEKAIMQLCGWKSRAVFDRYAVLSSKDLQERVNSLPGLGGSQETGQDSGQVEKQGKGN